MISTVDFDPVVDSLFTDLRAALTMHRSMAPTTNPVAQALPLLGRAELTHVVSQYSIFPAKIVPLLSAARSALKSWPGVEDELTRNLLEETGVATCGGSHFEILRLGLLDEYSLDVQTVDPLGATRRFIDTCFQLVTNDNPGAAAGAVYAVEASAVSEIEVLRNVLNELSRQTNGQDLDNESLVRSFIELHVETFEPAHEAGLREALQRYLGNSGGSSCFRDGFHRMLEAMDVWWTGLHDDADSGTPPRRQLLGPCDFGGLSSDPSYRLAVQTAAFDRY